LPAGFDLTESGISKKGVIVVTYAHAGDVKTGPIDHEFPSEAELSRREKAEATEKAGENSLAGLDRGQS
jgi:hypothetical protein